MSKSYQSLKVQQNSILSLSYAQLRITFKTKQISFEMMTAGTVLRYFWSGRGSGWRSKVSYMNLFAGRGKASQVVLRDKYRHYISLAFSHGVSPSTSLDS